MNASTSSSRHGTSRRQLLGFLALSPFIVKASSLMPVKALLAEPMTIAPIVPQQQVVYGYVIRVKGIDQFAKPVWEDVEIKGGGIHTLQKFTDITEIVEMEPATLRLAT